MYFLDILVIDDDGVTAMFLKKKLEFEAPNFKVEYLRTASECLEYIKTHHVDCILSDYQMAPMNGLELLIAIRETSDLPFIFLTGQGSEEVAREAFKHGATDYFTKEHGFAHYPRIINAIEKAVRQRKVFNDHQIAEHKLILSRSRLETLAALGQMTSATVPELCDFALEKSIEVTDSRIGYLYFYDEDTKLFTLYSWSKEAMKQCEVQEKNTVYELDKTGIWGEAIRQRRPIVTNDFFTPDPLRKGYPEGHVQLIRHMNLPIFDKDRIVAILGVGNKPTLYDEDDVIQLNLLMEGTWRIILARKAEEALRLSEHRLRGMLEGMLAGVYIVSGTKIVYVNRRLADILGYTAEELIGQEITKFIHPDDCDIVRNSIDGLTTGIYDSVRTNIRCISKDGLVMCVEVLGTLISHQGGYAVSGTLMDVSGRNSTV